MQFYSLFQSYDIRFILTILLITFLIVIVPITGWYLNIYLKKELFKPLRIEDYLHNLFILFSCCFFLIVILLGKEFFYTNDAIIERLNSIIRLYKDLQLFLIILKGVFLLLPTIIIYLWIKISKIIKKFRSNSHNIVCNILLKIFFYLSSSLIVYLILSIKCTYLLPYLALNKLIVLIKNTSIDIFIKRPKPRYIFPENIPVSLEGPPIIEPNSEFKERVKNKILSVLGYTDLNRGTNNYFTRFNNHHWEFLGSILGERQNIHNKYVILRESFYNRIEEISLVPADKLAHFPLLIHDNNIGEYIHVWTRLYSPDYGLNLYKNSLEDSIYYKAYHTIYAPHEPSDTIFFFNGRGDPQTYRACYAQHGGKRLGIKIRFDDGTSNIFLLNITSPKRNSLIIPLCQSDWLGMYFNNTEEPTKSTIIDTLEERRQMLDQRIHGVCNKSTIWRIE